MNIKGTKKINIRPTSGVYATYKRLSYQPWTAIAEFVDNSTQSYFDHREELKKIPSFEKLNIKISYQTDANGNDTLTITDNAFGMESEDFERAIVLDKAPKNRSGRNEFGMGLKTAACWFGTKWTVITTQYGSPYKYSAALDVSKLERDKDEEVDSDIFEADPSEHYTIIKIENLNKKITGARTIGKIRTLLANIYRQDLRNGEISITYADKNLYYEEPKIYEETDENGNKKQWKENIEFSIDHEGESLQVKGFIAIRIPASVKEAGFTLMRRGRVIVGGPEKNYRPLEIFGESNSYPYQRLFGELHMDNWPVTQAKDDFDWHNSGLEEKFIEALLPLTKLFRQKAETIRRRKEIQTQSILEDISKSFEKAGIVTDSTVEPKESPTINAPLLLDSSSGEDLVINNQKTVWNLNYNSKQITFEVYFDFLSPHSDWLVVTGDDSKYNLNLNMNHPFLEPFKTNIEIINTVAKLGIALVFAELEAYTIYSNGTLDPSFIRREMNSILKKFALKEETDDE